MHNKKNDIITNVVSVSDTLSIIFHVLQDEERTLSDNTIASSVLGLSNYLSHIVDDIEQLETK